MHRLQQFGWDDVWSRHFSTSALDGQVPGRVLTEHRGGFHVLTEAGEWLANPTGRLRHDAHGRGDLPAVGDWVVLSHAADDERAQIHAVLPRRTVFWRKAAGTAWEQQVVAANVTTLFLVNALNQDFNLRRLERYLVLASESGAQPVVVLNKADLSTDPQADREAAMAAAPDVPVHLVSAGSGEGVDDLCQYLGPQATVALLGSSGVGKSTLVNRLLGQEFNRTQAVRAGDDRGRHTTTHRQLVPLAGGGVLIDTPGMRELGMWASEDGLHHAFQDVEALAAACRFRNCQHGREPGCAVQAAIAAGELAAGRLSSYRKLERELDHQELKGDPARQRAFKAEVKRLHRAFRARDRDRQ